MTYLRSRLVPLILVAALPASGIVFVRTAEAEAPSAGASTAFEAGSDSRARRLIRELRQELAPVEDQIRNHPYLAALENGEVSLDNLRAFAGEQYNIIASDLRSDALLVSRFGATPTGEFFRGIFEGEVLALPLLLDFAAALGLDEEDLKAYEPRPGAQVFPAEVVVLASYGNQADVAAAFLLNFAVFGENTGRMAEALRTRYGFTPGETAFFDFFAEPIPGFEEDALAVIAEGLDQGAEPRRIKRAARLLQAYELFFWDAVAEG
jgi:pyrroloquinoline quinone (PQQ) biosynthesis protein C